MVISSTQTCHIINADLSSPSVTSMAVGCHHFGSRLSPPWQSDYRYLAVAAKPLAMAVEPECGRILSTTLHPTQIRLNCLIIREFKQCRVELTLHSLNTLYINYLQWICVGWRVDGKIHRRSANTYIKYAVRARIGHPWCMTHRERACRSCALL